MALASLAYLLPLDLATGNRVAVRVCSAQDRRVTGLGNMVWEPAMKAAPDLTINLWNGDFKNSVDPGSANFSINMNVVKKTWPDADRYDWNGAPVAIYADEMGTAWPWTMRFSGVISSRTRKKQTLAITADVDKAAFDKSILTGTYAGTGGVEGGSDIKNRLKPLVLGWASNVEPILINAVYNVYQFSAYGAIEGVIGLYERASSFGAAIGDYASYDALVAATIPAGKWATCLAQGLVRLGAPAYGVITGDIKGHKVGAATPRLTGAVIKAMATIAGVDGLKINTASLDALDATVPYPVNIVITSQTKFLAQANAMALACNAQGGIALNGTYFAIPVNFALTPAMTLDALGRSLPQVVSSEELEVSVPYWKTIMGAAQSWRVHSADEISFAATLVEQGLYSATATYREGNIVELSNGSRWLYTATTATTGNAPPSWPTASNTWWSNLTPPTSAANITYASGATLESLKPAQAGADVTSSNVAASVTGQGPLATVSSAAPYANANVPLGQNLIINSDMTLMDAGFSSTYPLGFEFAWQGNMTNIAAITWADARVQMADKTYAMQRTLSGVAPTPANSVFDGIQIANTGAALARFCIPVQAGDVLFASAFIGHQNCSSGGVVVGYLDENGAYVGEAGVTYATADIGTTAATALRRDHLGRSTGFVTVPADGTFSNGTGRCRWARIWTRFNLTGNPATARGVSSGLMLAKVASGQTAIPAYSSGPSDRMATFGAMTGSTLSSGSLGVLTDGQVVTNQGTAAAITGQGALATSGLTAAQVTNTNIPLAGQNRVPFSLFEAGVTTGWGFFADANATPQTRTATAYGGFPAVTLTGTATAAGPRVVLEGAQFAVTGSEYLMVAAQGVAGSNTNVTAQVLFTNAADGYITELNASTVTSGLTGRSAAIIQVPSNAAKARFRVFISANAAGSMSATVGQPMVCGAMAGQSTLPAFSAGPNAFNAADVTSSNTAAGITGQSSWATYSGLSPAQVVAPNGNLLKNPSFKLGLSNWGQSAAVFNTAFSGGDVGAYFAYVYDNTNKYLYTLDKIGIFASNTYTFQIYASGSWTPVGVSRPYIKIDFFNASDVWVGGSSATYIDSGGGFKTYVTTGTSPANAVWARVYVFTPNGGTNNGLYFSKAKLELGSVATPFTDDATNSAAYADGTVMDSLKPAQIGSDKTSSNTAAGISGQSSWATYNGLLPGSVAGQVQYLDTGGNLSGFQRITDRRLTLLLRADGSTAVTEGAVVTSLGTAAAISGQSSWATYTQFTPNQALAAGAGGNIIWKPSFGDGSAGAWAGSAAPIIVAGNGQDGSGEMGQTGRDLYETGNYLSVAPNDRLYVQAWCYNGSAGGFTARIGLQFTDASGNNPQWIGGASLANGNGWTLISGWITVPSGAARAIPWLQNEGAATGNPYIAWNKLYIGRSQPGSDVTGANTAAAIVNQGSLATRNDVTTPYIAAGAVLSTTMATATNMVWTGLTPHLVCSITIQPYSSTSTILIMGSWQAKAQNSSNIQFIRCEVVNQNTNEVISTTEYRNDTGLAQGLVIPLNATLSGISAQTTLNVVLYPPYAAGTTTTTMALVSITALEIKK